MLSPKSDLVMLNATEKEKKPNKLYNHHECDVRTIKSKRSFTNNNKKPATNVPPWARVIASRMSLK